MKAVNILLALQLAGVSSRLLNWSVSHLCGYVLCSRHGAKAALKAAGGVVTLLEGQLPTLASAEYTATRAEVQNLSKLVGSDDSFRYMLRSGGVYT